MVVITLICSVIAFIEFICSVGIIIVGFSTDLFDQQIEDNKPGTILLCCYTIVYSLLISFGSIKIMNHLFKMVLIIIVLLGYLNIVPVVFSLLQLFSLDSFDTWIMIIIIILTLIIDIFFLLHSLFSIYFTVYCFVCYILFLNKTYSKPPNNISTDDIGFTQLTEDMSSNGVMYFSYAPGSTNHFRRRVLENDIQQLTNKCITTVVCCLTNNDLTRLNMNGYQQVLESHGITYLHCPMVDYWIPENRALYDSMINRVKTVLENGEVVLVHCNSGKGRTGLFAAGVLSKILPGESSSYYIKQIRLCLPGAFDTFLQRLYFHMYINKIY
ncbi:hypothetical protein ENUP19_0054G0087 [Entamoeba nuttalli]|uniref:Tyrosine specific protein phosphatases domain-containing protein n=2 Tax=Entamoeba nuttalli TaxID=412467 RepID=K2H7N4_ENTNP|nr:hypothetical protein ENU1_015960 [Entamoeba nuttalli P19]EKE42597.1 hypothetical protein ENU1_015960 [Entamoeba nuttalli P19]|eukprot:XP_008855068.1 hypothetical protein ENU1_015960 [Entamoeba nuttalli P19]